MFGGQIRSLRRAFTNAALVVVDCLIAVCSAGQALVPLFSKFLNMVFRSFKLQCILDHRYLLLCFFNFNKDHLYVSNWQHNQIQWYSCGLVHLETG